MELELRHLRVLIAIADQGSISGAAAQLGISQPSLSSQLARIEGELGTRLFLRTRTGIKPTPAGDAVCDRARALVAGFEELTSLSAVDHERPPLRISANRTVGFSRLYNGLVGALPGRVLQPHTSTSTAVISELLETNQLDLALIGVHRGYDDHECAPMRDRVIVECEPFFVAMSTEHRLAGQVEVDLADLGEDEWLLPPGRPDGSLAALTGCFREAGISPPAPLGRQRLNDYAAYVAAGRAVAVDLATAPSYAGVIYKPIRGLPMYGTRVLRWHPDAVSIEEVERCVEVARSCFQEDLQLTAMTREWWTQAPWHRPVMDPGEERPIRPPGS